MLDNLMRHYLGKKMFRIKLPVKSKQLPLNEKCICLTIPSVNSVF